MSQYVEHIKRQFSDSFQPLWHIYQKVILTILEHQRGLLMKGQTRQSPSGDKVLYVMLM